MKCRLIREELVTHPDLKGWQDLRELCHQFHTGQITAEEYDKRRRITAPAGTVIDHPFAWMLVALGRAEPVDEECQRRASSAMPGVGDFDVKLVNAQEAADRLDNAQVTGDPQFDATADQAAKMKQQRAERLAAARQSPSGS